MSLEKDEYGRITRIEIGGNVHGGDSVCNVCGKDMPGVWDTVCYVCGITLCYDHSKAVDGKWLCPQHSKQTVILKGLLK